MSPNIKLNGYLSILIFGYVIILHSYLGHFCLLLENNFTKETSPTEEVSLIDLSPDKPSYDVTRKYCN